MGRHQYTRSHVFARNADKNKRNGQRCSHKAEYQNRPSATLRTFVHVSHRSVSHGDFSNFSFSGLLTWAESHKNTRGSSKPRYRNLVNEKARCACNPVIPSMPVSNGPPTGSLRQVPVEFRNLRHRCARDTCGAGRHPSSGASLPGARPRSWLAE